MKPYHSLQEKTPSPDDPNLVSIQDLEAPSNVRLRPKIGRPLARTLGWTALLAGMGVAVAVGAEVASEPPRLDRTLRNGAATTLPLAVVDDSPPTPSSSTLDEEPMPTRPAEKSDLTGLTTRWPGTDLGKEGSSELRLEGVQITERRPDGLIFVRPSDQPERLPLAVLTPVGTTPVPPVGSIVKVKGTLIAVRDSDDDRITGLVPDDIVLRASHVWVPER
ncbi:MAG: hypothetical protein AAGA56_09335 [Myxococcota bacterium]